LKVDLRNENHETVATFTTGEVSSSNANWQDVYHCFSNYPAGVRYIYWEDAGKGRRGVFLSNSAVFIQQRESLSSKRPFVICISTNFH
jgi:hypothetical protein